MQIFAFGLNVYIHIRSIFFFLGGGNFYIDYGNEIIVIHVFVLFDFVLIYLRIDNNELKPKLAYNRKFYNDIFKKKQFN